MANKTTQTKPIETPVTRAKKDYVFATGSRREAVARIRLYEHVRDDLVWGTTPVKKGDMLVNGKPITEYFSSLVMRHMFSEPFRVTNTTNKFALTIRVVGGGQAGQLDAVIHGIANALSLLRPEEYRTILKKKGFLTRDPRAKERRKVGNKGKARAKMSSPKR